MIELVVPGEPHPKKRPRIGRGGNTYTPRETVAAEDAIGWELRKAGVRSPLESEVRVELHFHCGELQGNQRRSDLDNLVKLVLDACNTIAWADDRQVTQLCAYRHDDAPGPRTEISIAAA